LFREARTRHGHGSKHRAIALIVLQHGQQKKKTRQQKKQREKSALGLGVAASGTKIGITRQAHIISATLPTFRCLVSTCVLLRAFSARPRIFFASRREIALHPATLKAFSLFSGPRLPLPLDRHGEWRCCFGFGCVCDIFVVFVVR
jgi:hypothetical protein